MLAAGKSRASLFAKTLKINSLSIPSTSTQNYPGPFKVDEYEVKMKEYLRLAISSLTNLTTVMCVFYDIPNSPILRLSPIYRWNVNHWDPQWSIYAVIDALTTLPLLQDFRINVANVTTPLPPLNHLSGLKRITCSGVRNHPHIDNSLVDLIAQSPRLAYLEVGTGLWHASEIITLHELLAKVSPIAPLRLQHLILRDTFCRLDDFTLPHLRCLAFLDLSNCPPDRLVESPSIGPLNRVEKHRSTISEIFATLNRERIHLRGVSVDDLCSAVIDYLGSYSDRLENFQVPYFYSDNAVQSNALAERFYTSILPMHANAIRVFCIRSTSEGGWCFNDQSMSAMLQCKRLTSITVVLDSASCHRGGGEVNFDDTVSLTV